MIGFIVVVSDLWSYILDSQVKRGVKVVTTWLQVRLGSQGGGSIDVVDLNHCLATFDFDMQLFYSSIATLCNFGK